MFDFRYNNMQNPSDVKGFTGDWDYFSRKFYPQNSMRTTILEWIIKWFLFGWLWMR